MSLEANTCTIELSTGSFIEIAETPQAVMEHRFQHLGTGKLMRLPRLAGTSRPDADYRQEVYVDPHQIVAVYPLDERPAPPRRVYVDRVEASTT